MKIIVCAKLINGELNPFDESALETALKIPDSEVTVVSMGPESWKDKLNTVSRLGVKRVILISDKLFAGSDTLATAHVLSSCIKQLPYDAIFCGRQTTDGDTAQVGPCLGIMLGMEPVTNVMSISAWEGGFECATRLGDVKTTLPALLTLERINTLRFPSLRSKPVGVEVWDNSRVGASPEKCGLDGSPTKVMQVFEATGGQRKCKFISKEELVPLIEKLKLQAMQENKVKESTAKLPLIWAMSPKLEAHARALAEEVKIFDVENPYEAAKLIKEEKPPVVLWNADLTGRRIAPMVAGLLETGLCADCTSLETDGKTLFMYRPARSGNVIAKIKCDTLPQMATVRTDEKSYDIILSVGKGIAGDMERARAFAKELGAELASSRGMVDAGLMPYSAQVGLTGKNVCPKIYIAAGISGAVHHTVGIENAGVVIAINPDKDARIFEYADYGITDKF